MTGPVSPRPQDATFAQQRLTGELGDARAQLAALKAARDQVCACP